MEYLNETPHQVRSYEPKFWIFSYMGTKYSPKRPFEIYHFRL